MTFRLLAAIWLALHAPAVIAGEADGKFQIAGDRLILDTESVAEGLVDQIEASDADDLLRLLQAHPEIRVVELNSTGGSYWAGRRMADTIIDFDRDTHVNGECSSICTRVFLAGTRRTMSRGSRIGFHQFWWSPPSIERYYADKAESEGWNSPFEFAAWIYTDPQSEIHENLIYMVRRKVDPVFAIETLKTPPDDLWYPYRIRLLAAGVLTE